MMKLKQVKKDSRLSSVINAENISHPSLLSSIFHIGKNMKIFLFFAGKRLMPSMGVLPSKLWMAETWNLVFGEIPTPMNDIFN